MSRECTACAGTLCTYPDCFMGELDAAIPPAALHLPEPWKPTEAQMLEGAGIYVQQSGRAMRPPIAPGVLLEDDEARVYVSRGVLRIVGRWALGFGMVAAGAAVMYAEGQRQPQPGVGFAIGLALIMGAAFLVRGRDDG